LGGTVNLIGCVLTSHLPQPETGRPQMPLATGEGRPFAIAALK